MVEFVRATKADENKPLEAEKETVDGLEVYRLRNIALFEGYTLALDYDANGNIIYFGQAIPGSSPSASVWRLRKFVYDANGNLLNVLWANGAKTFINAWTDRGALGYA